tara:strand:+ start:147 stop:512 length:366 start_codon:yes stop_codon:yes gene_type:complete
MSTEHKHDVFCDPHYSPKNIEKDITGDENLIINAWKALYEQATREITLQKREILELKSRLSSAHCKIEELQWENDGLKGTIENQAITIQDLYTDLTKYEVEPRDDNLIWDDVEGKWIEKCY